MSRNQGNPRVSDTNCRENSVASRELGCRRPPSCDCPNADAVEWSLLLHPLTAEPLYLVLRHPDGAAKAHDLQPPVALQLLKELGADRKLLGGGVGAGGLQVFDVSDPTSPTKLATFDTPGQTLGVTVKGNLAYVADGQAGLQIVDLSNPSAPRVVGGFATERPARSVAVAGSLVLVVVGEGDYWGDDQSDGADREVLILRQAS